MLSAANDERVVVQYVHNFSFLIYRPSAAPDILTANNKERSAKAISCVNVEGDEAAFGTRASINSARSEAPHDFSDGFGSTVFIFNLGLPSFRTDHAT